MPDVGKDDPEIKAAWTRDSGKTSVNQPLRRPMACHTFAIMPARVHVGRSASEPSMKV